MIESTIKNKCYNPKQIPKVSRKEESTRRSKNRNLKMSPMLEKIRKDKKKMTRSGRRN